MGPFYWMYEYTNNIQWLSDTSRLIQEVPSYVLQFMYSTTNVMRVSGSIFLETHLER